MPHALDSANGPVDEGSQNAATATPETSQNKPVEATTATDAAGPQVKASEVLADSSAEASEETGIDWKASSRKWERQSKENLRRVEELMESINSKDATVEELRAQVKAFEHAAQVDEWKAQVAADLGVKVEALRGTAWRRSRRTPRSSRSCTRTRPQRSLRLVSRGRATTRPGRRTCRWMTRSRPLRRRETTSWPHP